MTARLLLLTLVLPSAAFADDWPQWRGPARNGISAERGWRDVWTKNVASECGAPAPGWGFSGSPVIVDQLLLLYIGDAGVALEKATGKIVWKSKGAECGYSTPFPTSKGLILSSAKAYVAVNPTTGAELWRHKWVTEYNVNAADPVLEGDRIFISTGYGKGG